MLENIFVSKFLKTIYFLPLLLFLISSSLFNTVLSKQEKPSTDNLQLLFVYELVRNGARGPIAS